MLVAEEFFIISVIKMISPEYYLWPLMEDNENSNKEQIM